MLTLALLATFGCNAPTGAADVIDPVDTAAGEDTAEDDGAPDTDTADTDTAEDTGGTDTDTAEDTADTGTADTGTADTDTGPTEDPAPPCYTEDGTLYGLNLVDEIVLYADPADGDQTYAGTVRGCGGSLVISCSSGVTATLSASIVTADTAPLALTITWDGAVPPAEHRCTIVGSYTNPAGAVGGMSDYVKIWVL